MPLRQKKGAGAAVVEAQAVSTRSIWWLAVLVFISVCYGHLAMLVGLAGLNICPHFFKAEEFWIVNSA